MGDKVNAVHKARELNKARNDDLHMYETPSGMFIITERDLSSDYEEVRFRSFSNSDLHHMKNDELV